MPSERQMLIATLKDELARTKRVIAAYPAAQAELRPHPTSNSARELVHTFCVEAVISTAAANGTLDASKITGFPPAPATWGEVTAAFEGAQAGMLQAVEAMSDADVIYVLRMQHERMEPGQNFVPTLREYARVWGVNARRVRPGQVVMHPGPMNRGVEIAPDVADSGASLVEDQVEAGLIVRMAVLYDLMTRPSIGQVIDIRERTGEWGVA